MTPADLAPTRRRHLTDRHPATLLGVAAMVVAVGVVVAFGWWAL